MEQRKSTVARLFEGKGRAARQEFWLLFFCSFPLGAVVVFFCGFIAQASEDFALLMLIVLLGSLSWANVATAVRRLHDVGRSGHWLWISLTGVGILVLLYWFVQPSSAQTNDMEDSPTQGGTATASSDTEPEPPQQTSDIIR